MTAATTGGAGVAAAAAGYTPQQWAMAQQQNWQQWEQWQQQYAQWQQQYGEKVSKKYFDSWIISESQGTTR